MYWRAAAIALLFVGPVLSCPTGNHGGTHGPAVSKDGICKPGTPAYDFVPATGTGTGARLALNECPWPEQCPLPGPPLPVGALPAPAYRRVPLGSVQVGGWLQRQLITQANGISGWYQALFYPLVNQSSWIGGDKMVQPVQWATYWLNGNVPLVGLLQSSPGATEQLDHDLGSIVDRYLSYVLDAQATATDPGRMGPQQCGWQFPTMNAHRALLLWAEYKRNATLTARVGTAIEASLRNLQNCTASGLSSGGARWPSHAEAVIEAIDAFPRLANADVLGLIRDWRSSGAGWEQYYANASFPTPFPRGPSVPTHAGTVGMFHHGVNTAEGLKFGAVQWRLWRRESDAAALPHALELLDLFHGHPQGTWGADELLAGRVLSRGTELCDVVEAMYSLAWAFRQVGTGARGGENANGTMARAYCAALDRVERLAFNAFPGTCTADMWQHQYDQQANAIAAQPGVLCGGSNGGMATVFGLQPNYPCCTVNMPQGWPKLAMSAILVGAEADADAEAHHAAAAREVVVAHLLPVSASIDGVARVNITTDYPFGDTVDLTIEALADVALRVRVPGWAADANIAHDGRAPAPLGPFAGALWCAPQILAAGTTSQLHIELNPRIEVSDGWGAFASAGPAPVNRTADPLGRVPVESPEHDWLFLGGAGSTSSRDGQGSSDIRSGSPGQTSTAVVVHAIDACDQALESVSLSFQYVVGYNDQPGAAITHPNVSLLLIDAFNSSHELATLWTSGPLTNYSFDRFTGYSPPVAGSIAGLDAQLTSGQCVGIALRFHNNAHNVQVKLSTMNISVTWQPSSMHSQQGCQCSAPVPATNAVAVFRGPLVYALQLPQDVANVRQPASGGECESEACHARDIGISTKAAWNYALVLGNLNRTSNFRFERLSASRRLPFNGSSPSLLIHGTGRRLPQWGTLPGRSTVAAPPPASPITCKSKNTANVCGLPEPIVLVPFGMTQIRVAGLPWVIE